MCELDCCREKLPPIQASDPVRRATLITFPDVGANIKMAPWCAWLRDERQQTSGRMATDQDQLARSIVSSCTFTAWKYLERSSHFLNLLRQSHISDGLICRRTTQMGSYADFSVPRNIRSFNSMLVSRVDTLCSCGSIVLDCNKKGLFPQCNRRQRTTRWLAFMSYNGAFSVLSPVWHKVYVCKP